MVSSMLESDEGPERAGARSRSKTWLRAMATQECEKLEKDDCM